MRAITLWRPWPHAILLGGKPVENRSWKPPRHVVGSTIALHAGKVYDHDAARWMREEGLYDPPADQWCPSMAIVGTARISQCVVTMDSPWFFGPYGWVLKDIVALEQPILCKGRQGLWLVPEDIVEAIRKQIRKQGGRL